MTLAFRKLTPYSERGKEGRSANSRCSVISNLSAQFSDSGSYRQLGVIRVTFVDDMAFVMALERGVTFAQAKLKGIPG